MWLQTGKSKALTGIFCSSEWNWIMLMDNPLNLSTPRLFALVLHFSCLLYWRISCPLTQADCVEWIFWSVLPTDMMCCEAGLWKTSVCDLNIEASDKLFRSIQLGSKNWNECPFWVKSGWLVEGFLVCLHILRGWNICFCSLVKGVRRRSLGLN